MSTGRKLRILILLLVLLAVALDAWLTRARTTSWERSLWVRLYPIAGDDSPATRAYVDELQRAAFAPLETFMLLETRRYGVALEKPVHVELGRVLHELPPLLPEDRAPLSVAWWSLKLRWWARGIDADQPGPRADARLFVVYYDPERRQVLDHSTGLQEGLVGIVHAYAARSLAARNNVVIAHELLHTLGATDKYDFGTLQPSFPDGYADPQQQPLHPQRRAELMGGRIALSPGEVEMPAGLGSVVIGPATALEIGLVEPR